MAAVVSGKGLLVPGWDKGGPAVRAGSGEYIPVGLFPFEGWGPRRMIPSYLTVVAGWFWFRSVVEMVPVLVSGSVVSSAVFTGLTCTRVPVIIPLGFVSRVVRSVVPVRSVVSVFVAELVVRSVVPDSVVRPSMFVIRVFISRLPLRAGLPLGGFASRGVWFPAFPVCCSADGGISFVWLLRVVCAVVRSSGP